jgi:drug/metabolite transporter (DMT)-like permease
MAAYAGLAFLSFIWGSSFLLIKIASRAFDPLEFALARVGVAAAAMLLTSALSGTVWPGPRPGLWARLVALALIGQVVPFLLLGQAARLTTSADMALMMGAQPIFVFLFRRFLGSRDRWTWLAALGLAVGFAGSPSPSGRQERIVAPIPYWAGLSLWPRVSSMEQAQSSPGRPREKSALSDR